jgi:hypothetical protein
LGNDLSCASCCWCLMFVLEWAIPSLCYRVGMRISAVSLDNDTKPLTPSFRRSNSASS